MFQDQEKPRDGDAVAAHSNAHADCKATPSGTAPANPNAPPTPSLYQSLPPSPPTAPVIPSVPIMAPAVANIKPVDAADAMVFLGGNGFSGADKPGASLSAYADPDENVPLGVARGKCTFSQETSMSDDRSKIEQADGASCDGLFCQSCGNGEALVPGVKN